MKCRFVTYILLAICVVISTLVNPKQTSAQSTSKSSSIQATPEGWKPNWLAVSDPDELNRTWASALVYLPEILNHRSGRLLKDEDSLNSKILKTLNGAKLPLIIYLHACEGLGHHREDIDKLSKLGFAVIAIDSFARLHHPMGCYEEKERYIRYYDIAVAFRKAELDYAVNRIKRLPWVDSTQQFLIGSGTGGMVVAHYQGTEFAGHVIEGWGCRHPHSIFDGIWTPLSVPIYSVVSKNDRWYKDVPGFGIDCRSFLKDRPNSVSIVLERPAHYVSWYPRSRGPLIRFLTRDMDVDQEALIDDTPKIVQSDDTGITLIPKWSGEDAYDYANKYCAKLGKTSYATRTTEQGIYKFVCS